MFGAAFPERLRGGEKEEPGFLITTPYSEEKVRLAVSQAMLLASTETLLAWALRRCPVAGHRPLAALRRRPCRPAGP